MIRITVSLSAILAIGSYRKTIQIFKNKHFNKWARKEGVDDSALVATIKDMNQGLIHADLSGHVFKQRVAVKGSG